eukprot:TRINITY_DN650_c0_g1_i1.p1 TRINITY_DN650_c0_g1~~TRINITY_DN650_c0_g1_i1.p1  ORF type:complete len:141 (-),score=21.87 TRINITY_DN650_c0_g1_i1:40-441(-)
MYYTTFLVQITVLTELVLLTILLLPLPAFISRFTTRLLKGINVYFLGFFALIVCYLFFDSYQSYNKYQEREMPEELLGRTELLKKRFRTEAQFYLNCFSFVSMIIIFRVRQVVSKLARLEEEISALNEKVKTD